MYQVRRIILLFDTIRQQDNVIFLADSVQKYCQCAQCRTELQEEIDLLQANWRLVFSAN